jgi:hypothetical protein
MERLPLEYKIFIDDNTENNIRTGYLELKCTKNITFDSIKGFILFEIKGKSENVKVEILSFEICSNKTLIKNETYKFPFTFKFEEKDIKRGSYYGKNTSFHFECELRLEVNKDDIKKSDDSFFSKIYLFNKSDKTIKISQYFGVKQSNNKYQITQNKEKYFLKNKISLHTIDHLPLHLFSLIILFIIVANTPKEYSFLFILFPIMVFCYFYLLSASFLDYLFGDWRKKFGVLSLEQIINEDAFLCHIEELKPLSLKNTCIFYQVIEKVLDFRSDYSEAFNEVIFTSKKYNISDLTKSQSFKFNFPQKKGLESFESEGASIIWKLYLIGEYWGFTIKFDCEFEIGRM